MTPMTTVLAQQLRTGHDVSASQPVAQGNDVDGRPYAFAIFSIPMDNPTITRLASKLRIHFEASWETVPTARTATAPGSYWFEFMAPSDWQGGSVNPHTGLPQNPSFGFSLAYDANGNPAKHYRLRTDTRDGPSSTHGGAELRSSREIG